MIFLILRVKVKIQERTKNFFDGSANSDSEDDTKTSIVDKSLLKKEGTCAELLPNPLRAPDQRLPSLNELSTMSVETSVFGNRYEEERKKKLKILEQHVQLSEPAPKKPANKRICYNFKKGKCFRGKNCRFFHDSSNIIPGRSESCENNSENPSNSGNTSRAMFHPVAVMNARNSEITEEPVDEDHYLAGAKRKKRYGLNDHLIPPKKAFEALQRQREEERPWTVG